MARDRRIRPTTIYDNDATVITETPSNSSSADSTMPNVRSRRGTVRNIEIPVVDAFDTIATYLPQNVSVFRDNSSTCNCMICNNETAYFNRKICFDCMKKYGERICSLAHDSIESGNSTITLNTMA